MADIQTRKVQLAVSAAAVPKDSIDYWLGGFIVFGMVVGALVGGIVSAVILATAPGFTAAVQKTPLVIGWTVLIAAEGAVSWAGVLPAVSAWWVSTKAAERRNRKWLPMTLAAIVGAIALTFVLEPRVFPLHVPWPLGESHYARVGIMSFFVMIPPFLALAGMWSSAIAGFELSFDKFDDKKKDVDVVATFVELRERVQSLLWYLGVVIGGAMLATGALRQSMLDTGMTKEQYPSTLVLVYGAFFTLLLIISYVPAYLLLQRGGKRLVYRLADGDNVLAWNDQRQKLATMLVPTGTIGDTLKSTIAIFSPVVAGFLSLAFPK
ncbi:MAG: hypothetical protein HOV81_29850 [Kofleriaceae bacterium]|nr:hypothetical protein [Kofleriaceae bacterium]